MAHDVFISYSHVDKSVADAACAVVENAGNRCWMAPRDIPPGGDWAEAIVEAIDACRVLVLIFSSNSNSSRQVSREVQRALDRGVTIIPVRIEQIEPARALAYYLSGVHWLDALTPPLEKHLQALSRSIVALLNASNDTAEDVRPSRPNPARTARVAINRFSFRWPVLAVGVTLVLSGAYITYRLISSADDRCYFYNIGYDKLLQSDQVRDCQHGSVVAFAWEPTATNDVAAMLVRSTVRLSAYRGSPKRWEQFYLPAGGQISKNADGSPYASFIFDAQDVDTAIDFRAGTVRRGIRSRRTSKLSKRGAASRCCPNREPRSQNRCLTSNGICATRPTLAIPTPKTAVGAGLRYL